MYIDIALTTIFYRSDEWLEFRKHLNGEFAELSFAVEDVVHDLNLHKVATDHYRIVTEKYQDFYKEILIPKDQSSIHLDFESNWLALQFRPSVATKIAIGDSSNLDAFARLRVSEAHTIFDSKLLFDADTEIWDDQQVSGSSTSSVYNINESSVSMTVSNNTAGKRIRQSYMRINYQPGKSQSVAVTGVLQESGGGTDITRQLGLFDDDNGLFFQDDSGIISVVIRSKTSGSVVDTVFAQTDWNIDKMDGTGVSGYTLDFTKVQYFIIDFAWQGVGKVRYGFLLDGVVCYCHQHANANSSKFVYMTTPNLPMRFVIENSGAGAAASITQICCAVVAEAGQDDIGVIHYCSTGANYTTASTPGTLYAVIGIRLKAAFIGQIIKLIKMSMLALTADDFEWALLFNPTVASTFTYSDEANTSLQVAMGVTANTVTDGHKVSGGFSSSSTAINEFLSNARYLGASITGTLDTLVLCVRPISANAQIVGSLSWREMA